MSKKSGKRGARQGNRAASGNNNNSSSSSRTKSAPQKSDRAGSKESDACVLCSHVGSLGEYWSFLSHRKKLDLLQVSDVRDKDGGGNGDDGDGDDDCNERDGWESNKRKNPPMH